MADVTIQQSFKLAVQHHQAGRLADAESVYRGILERSPDHPDALHLLGFLIHQKGDNDAGLQLIEKAIRLKPGVPDYHNNLGLILMEQKRIKEAIAAYRQAVALKPDYAAAHNNLGRALMADKRAKEALAAFQRAAALRPGYADTYLDLGAALFELRQFDEAIANFRKSLAIRPNHAEGYLQLGTTMFENGRLDEAIDAYRQALALRPDLADAMVHLSNALRCTGKVAEGVELLKKVLALHPESCGYYSSLLFIIQQDPAYDAAAILREHQRWNQLFAKPLEIFIQPHSNDRTPDRRLKVGYVSPDLYDHPVARFILLPLLANRNREQFEIFCYSDVPARKIDEVSKCLRGYADHWRDVAGLDDEQVATQIRQDGIDILIDTTAHTAENRLLLFARKPAPVQITSLFTTGVSAIDYRLTDRYADPPGQGDEFYSERSIRLPNCFWCFEPVEPMPPVSALPALSAGYVTFGSFNSFAKVNSYVLGLWMEVLTATPGSRLILQCPSNHRRNEIRAMFEAGGIAPQRLELVTWGTRQQYFERYHRVDICLDPTPYSGHTTSFDGLWMGTPFVTLSGRTVVGRAGVSILSNIGLTELIARTPEEYVSIAAKLAGDLPNLAKMRAGMRQRMLSSPVMDARGYARDNEAVYRSVWRAWCKADSVRN